MSAYMSRVCSFLSARSCSSVAKFYCAQPISVLSGRNACVVGRRYLFSAEILGLDNYKRQKLSMSEKIGGMKEKFCSRMAEYVKTSQSNTIFTEDLKSMVYIAESDAELDITLQMVRRFHLQNSDLRFSNFVFGPLVMRLLHMLNKPDEAYQLFTDKGLSGFFDQMSSFVILMDLLYDSKRYGQVLEVMDIVKDKQLGGFKYPMDCVTLAVASCYQLNTPESFKKLTSLIKDTGGAVGSVSLRSSIYASMLALTQGKPDVALELLSIVTIRPGLPTPVAYVNVKALTFAALGRVDDAIQTLRTIVDQDLPDHIKFRGEAFEEVLTAVRDVATKHATKDVLHQLDNTEKALRDGGHVSNQNLASYLSRPIIRQRRLQDGFKQRERPPVGGENRRPGGKRLYGRPGLLD